MNFVLRQCGRSNGGQSVGQSHCDLYSGFLLSHRCVDDNSGSGFLWFGVCFDRSGGIERDKKAAGGGRSFEEDVSMNYSGSKRLIEIFSAVKDAARNGNGRIDGVAAELQYETAMLANKHAHMADTPYSWGPTEAERDYLYRLKRLYHAVQDVSVQELPAWLEAEEKDVVRRMPKPKVAFFTQEFGLWPSFDSIWENYDGEKVDKELVFVYYEGEMTPDLAAKKNTELTAYIKAGYDPIPSEDYDFSKASPDIVYYMKPYKWRAVRTSFLRRKFQNTRRIRFFCFTVW